MYIYIYIYIIKSKIWGREKVGSLFYTDILLAFYDIA